MKSRSPRLFFLQMPVIHARGISDISVYNVFAYATNNIHRVAIHIGMALMK